MEVLKIKNFLVVGGLGTVINYLVFFLFFKFFGIGYIVASTAGYIAGLVFGYSFNRRITFKSENPRKMLELVRYVTVYSISLLLSLLFLHLLIKTFSLNPYLANISAIVLSTVTNFLGCTFFVFI